MEVADAEYGEYPRGPYRRYEGGYFAYRRSFNSLARLMRTCVEMEWAEDEGLIFHEHSQFQVGRRQVDNSQSGRIHISQTTGLMHLVTCVEGSVRLITLTKMMGGVEVMRGAVLTQMESASTLWNNGQWHMRVVHEAARYRRARVRPGHFQSRSSDTRHLLDNALIRSVAALGMPSHRDWHTFRCPLGSKRDG